MNNPFASLGTVFGGFLPSIIAAVVILIIGWIVAFVVSRLIASLLQRTGLDDRMANMLRSEQNTETTGPRVTHWVSTIVFWVIMAFAIVAFLQVLNLAVVSAPLGAMLNTVIGFIPSLISAAVLLFVAWVIATVLRMVITRVVGASSLSRRATENANVSSHTRVNLGETIGNIVYWLVFLLFLPAILGALNLTGILAPVQTMVNEVLAMLPNIFAAILILAVGYFAARIVRQIVVGLLDGIGLNRIGQRAGVPQNANTPNLANVIGSVVFVLIMIPVAIAALNALNIPAVSTPAATMLTTFLNALPAIFGAILLIALAYFVARLLGNFITSLLSGLGFDRFFNRTGLYQAVPAMQPNAIPATGGQEGVQQGWSPSRVIGTIVMVAIILFAIIAAANLLGFTVISAMVSNFLTLFGNILLGLAIFALGLWLASLADHAVRGSGANQANLLATAARVAIIIFSGALALRQMGLGQDIVNLAFGLLFGAVAVAVALAFGLGGRDVAARQLENWRKDIQNNPNIGAIPATGSSGGPSRSGSSFGSPGNSGSQSGHETGTGYGDKLSTQPSDMDYEGGANQMDKTSDIPPTGSSLGDAGSEPYGGGEARDLGSTQSAFDPNRDKDEGHVRGDIPDTGSVLHDSNTEPYDEDTSKDNTSFDPYRKTGDQSGEGGILPTGGAVDDKGEDDTTFDPYTDTDPDDDGDISPNL